jgi:hypothetical protein
MVATQGVSNSVSSIDLARSAKNSTSVFGNVITVGWYRDSKALPSAHLVGMSGWVLQRALAIEMTHIAFRSASE